MNLIQALAFGGMLAGIMVVGWNVERLFAARARYLAEMRKGASK